MLSSAECNVSNIIIDDISIIGSTVTAEFSSNPNAMFKCKLTNQRTRRCKSAMICNAECKLDINFKTIGISPVTYTGLDPGRYRLTVQAACLVKVFDAEHLTMKQ